MQPAVSTLTHSIISSEIKSVYDLNCDYIKVIEMSKFQVVI